MDNLADSVRRAATHDPDAPALIVPAPSGGRASPAGSNLTRITTWGQLDAQVDAVASALAALNLPETAGARARVAVALPNVPDFAVSLFGVLRAGLVAVPVNPGYTARELRFLLSDCGASVIIATGAVLSTVATVRAGLPELRSAYVVGDAAAMDQACMAEVVAFDQLTSPAPAPPAGATPAPGPAPDAGRAPAAFASRAGGDDLAVLLYTSGTGGNPKGVMLSHRALIANHRQLAAVEPPVVRPGDVVLLALPLFHAFGLNTGLGSVAWHGACGVLIDRFDPAESLDIIAEHAVSVVAAVPQMYAAWSLLPNVGRRMGSVRLAVSGASPLDLGAARRFREATGHPIFEGYGLTETAPVVATALVSPAYKSGSIGRPIPEVEIKLVSADGSEIARIGAAGIEAGVVDDFDDDAGGVPGTDPGEIVVRGPNLFGGYWPDGAGKPNSQGWWATGDVAYADADGDLFLVDRLDELIIVSGFNVYPYEVESVLTGYPGVVEAAVVPVTHRYTGQAVKAYVVLGDGATASAQDLMAHCERNLARFKCPAEIVFVPELPHSATGKVRKGLLTHGRSGNDQSQAGS